MTIWYRYLPYVRSYKFCRGYLILACAFQIVDFIHVKNIESNWMLTLYPEQFSGISPDLKWGWTYLGDIFISWVIKPLASVYLLASFAYALESS